MRLSECGNFKIAYENDTYMLAHLKCAVPKDIFTTDLHCCYKERREGKVVAFGFAWMSCGKDLNEFKRKAELCKNQIQKHEQLIKGLGKQENWPMSVRDFENEFKPMYLAFINFIESL